MAAGRRSVVWSLVAQRGLDDALGFIASDSVEAARRMAGLVLAAADSLTTLSERGRVVPELQDPTVRETFVHSCRLMYHVGATQVTVLAFLHGARDFERWRREIV